MSEKNNLIKLVGAIFFGALAFYFGQYIPGLILWIIGIIFFEKNPALYELIISYINTLVPKTEKKDKPDQNMEDSPGAIQFSGDNNKIFVDKSQHSIKSIKNKKNRARKN